MLANKKRHLQLSRLATFMLVPLLVIIFYGWTVMEPYYGDALKYTANAVPLHSLADFFSPFYQHVDPAWKLPPPFHRPVLDGLFVPLIKKYAGIGTPNLRVSVLIMFLITLCLFQLLLMRLQLGTGAWVTGSAWLAFSPPFFWGIWDYGLFPSTFMIFLGVASLYALVCYATAPPGGKRIAWLSVTLLFTFLCMFSKEAAGVFPGILILFALFFMYQKEKTTKAILRNRMHVLLLAGLAVMPLLYILSNYIKSGRFFPMTESIAITSFSWLDVIKKEIGFILYSLHLPVPPINTHYGMGPFLAGMSLFEITVRTGLFLFAVIMFYFSWKRSRLFFLVCMATMGLALLPTLTVWMLAPTYADILCISLAWLVASGLDAMTKAKSFGTFGTKWLPSEKIGLPSIGNVMPPVIILLLATSTFYTIRWHAANDKYAGWQALGMSEARAAANDFSAALSRTGVTPETIIGTSGMRERIWMFSKTAFGAFFHANFSIPLNRMQESDATQKTSEPHEAGQMFVDFFPGLGGVRYFPLWPFPGRGMLLTAYFPNGFATKPLKKTNGNIAPGAAKVIRLECDGSIPSDARISFLRGGGGPLHRTITPQMNLYRRYHHDNWSRPYDYISGASEKTLLEFVLPENTRIVELSRELEESCSTLKIEGYFPINTK